MSPNRRYELKKRDNFTCVYCGKKFEASELSIDHIVPKIRGGIDDNRNLVTACVECNKKKGSFLPSEFSKAVRRLRHNKKLGFSKEAKNIYLSLPLYYFCAGAFKYIPERIYSY